MAIIQHHILAVLNNRNLFITDLEAGKSKISVLANLIPGEMSPIALQMATILLYSKMAEGEGESKLSGVSSKNTSSVRSGPPPYDLV